MKAVEGPSGPLSGIEAPRLLPVPAALRDPGLVDGTEWAGVDVTGDVAGDMDAADVEVSRERLAGLRLTGWRFDLRDADFHASPC